MAFTSAESAEIRSRLLGAGRESFIRFGLKRTRIEDLTGAVGIAKGSFYNFFASKELLCFELLEQEERERDEALRAGAAAIESPEQLAELLIEGFDAFERSAIAMRLIELDEFQVLIRRLPPERIAEHQRRDDERMRTLFGEKGGLGRFLRGRPAVLAGMLRGIFMLSMHRAEIGEELFPEVRRTLLQGLAGGLWKKEGEQ